VYPPSFVLTVISAVPIERAETVPLELTEATVGLFDVQVTL
jgi:hypothetical protein